MASKGTVASAYAALLLCLNLLSFTMVSSTYVPAVPVSSGPACQKGTCPIDTLKFGVCAKVLNLVTVMPPILPCCNLFRGMADLQAVACICTALKANVLGFNLDVPLAMSTILTNCGRNTSGFLCP